MSDINQVRQILMNELGLSRTYIQDMAETLIKEEVIKRVEKMLREGVIEEIIRRDIIRVSSSSFYNRDGLMKIISEEAGKIFQSEVRKLLERNN